jgi:hypothetical protein
MKRARGYRDGLHCIAKSLFCFLDFLDPKRNVLVSDRGDNFVSSIGQLVEIQTGIAADYARRDYLLLPTQPPKAKTSEIIKGNA